MREGKVTFEGKKYYVTHSLGVMMAMEDKGYNTPQKRESIAGTVALIHECMVAGHQWAVTRGLDALEPPTFEELAANMDISDMQALLKELAPVIAGNRNVIAKAPKKAGGVTSGD